MLDAWMHVCRCACVAKVPSFAPCSLADHFVACVLSFMERSNFNFALVCILCLSACVAVYILSAFLFVFQGAPGMSTDTFSDPSPTNEHDEDADVLDASGVDMAGVCGWRVGALAAVVAAVAVVMVMMVVMCLPTESLSFSCALFACLEGSGCSRTLNRPHQR